MSGDHLSLPTPQSALFFSVWFFSFFFHIFLLYFSLHMSFSTLLLNRFFFLFLFALGFRVATLSRRFDLKWDSQKRGKKNPAILFA